MARRLFLLVETYFQKRDHQRYGIDRLRGRGIDVEVWEVFRPWRRRYAESYRPPDPAGASIVQHFTGMEDVLRGLDRLRRDDVIILGMHERWDTASLYRAVTQRQLRFGNVLLSTISPARPQRRFRLGTWQDWLQRIYLRLPRKIRRTTVPTFLLLCGGEVLAGSVQPGTATTALWSHALDYDIALEIGREAGPGRHVVFLDEYVPFHPDLLALGIVAPNTAAEYYPPLCRLFEAVENALGCPVVIAAHPRAHYQDRDSRFQGREVIRGQTGRLVRDARLVLTHSSVANTFTALYRKPVLVVTTNGLARSYYGPYIESIAQEFGAPVFNLDQPEAIAKERLLHVNDQNFDRIVRNYVKRPGTPERNTWDIFADWILS